jgi:hypothetical protein
LLVGSPRQDNVRPIAGAALRHRQFERNVPADPVRCIG